MRIPLNAPLFRRPATVVGDGRYVRDAADLETQRVQGAYGGFPSGAGAFDAHLEILHAALLCRAAGLLGRNLGGERRRFPRALEARGPRGRPCQGIALSIGNGDDGVVERGVNVGDALRRAARRPRSATFSKSRSWSSPERDGPGSGRGVGDGLSGRLGNASALR